jgi:hypothetical protein
MLGCAVHGNLRRVFSRVTCLCVAAMCLSFEYGFAQNYHPLDIGWQWEYESSAVGHQTMTITGELSVLGTTTRIRRQVEGDQTFENFWTSDDRGNLYIHGARNLTVPFEAAYLPPIQMVSAPLVLNSTWTTRDIRIFYLDGTSWGGDPFDYPLRVYSAGTMDVPAGEFFAYGVGYDIGPPPVLATGREEFDILGRWLGESAPRADNSTDWYAVNVGLVQQGPYANPEDEFRLLSYQGPPVPVLPVTWGSIKARFAAGR